MKKRSISLILAALLIMSLFAACGKTAEAPADAQNEAPAEPAKDEVELIVFAAASLQESLTQPGSYIYLISFRTQ